MMKQPPVSSLLLLIVIVTIAVATTAATTPALAPVRQHPALVSGDWIDDGVIPAPQQQHVEHVVTLMLKNEHTELLEQMFWERTDPQHPMYRQYLTADELTQLVQPSQQTIDTVSSWLRSLGATNIVMRGNNDVLRATMSVAAINKGFSGGGGGGGGGGVQMRYFRHSRESRMLIRAYERFVLPDRIAMLVDVVKGINDFPLGRKRRAIVPPRSGMPVSMTSSSNSPVLTAVRARGTVVSVEFQPRCADGSSPTSPTTLCAAPAIQSFQFFAVPTNPAYDWKNEVVVNVSSVTCSSSSSPSSNVVVCSVDFKVPTWIAYYQVAQVSMRTVYTGGSTTLSDMGTAPFATMPSPPVVPQTLYKLYNMPLGLRGTNPNNSIAVVEFESQFYSQTDYELYFAEMGLPPPPPVKVIGPNDESNPGVEANLDIMVAAALAVNVPMTFWSIKANGTVEIDDILQFLNAIAADSNPPLVSSLSYGMAADQVDKYLGQGYLARSDVEMMKVAMRGLSIIIASGDTGVGDLGAPPMSEPTCTTFHADWPSQSPYVTSIGSTAITPQAEPICYDNSQGVQCIENPLGEVLASLEQGGLFTGGGGFSERTATPPYQTQEVLDYLNRSQAANLLPPLTMFNPKGRAYCDAVAVGVNLEVAFKGSFMSVDGTSASAPIFAGLLAMLNEQELNANRPPLGFINPLMYSTGRKHPDAFNDVTVGSNACGAYGWNPLCCASGFHALPGFDAVSGLGSPNFGRMAELLAAAGGGGGKDL